MSDIDRTNPLGDLLSPAARSVVPRIPDSLLNPAKCMYERIVRSINSFEEDLDQEHEVGARLVTFGPDMTIHIDDVGYWGPDIIIFHGTDKNSQKVKLVQHISQLSVLLVAVSKIHDTPRRIGFQLLESIENEKGRSTSD